MKLRPLLLAACLLLGGAGWAAGSLDAQRAAVKASREQVGALRADQLAKRTELSKLSSRIEALKASQKGALLPGSELDSALKTSQELSSSLTGLAQQLSARDSELESAQLSLLDGLSRELSRLRAEFDRQSDRAARKATIEKMKSVRQEREAIRAALPATRLPAMDALRPSDDPETLLEQADLLRDREEKLQKELKAVEQRLAEKKEEIELDRRVQRFMGEESLFDDQDRRLRLQRVTESGESRTVPQAPAAETAKNDSASPSASVGGTPTGGLGSPAPGGGGTNGTDFSGGQTPAAPPAAPGVTGSADPSAVKVTTRSETRPLFGGGGAIATGDEDETNDLEVQRARLKGLADELKKKASELEKKAAQLK